jgi:hypothetical protein
LRAALAAADDDAAAAAAARPSGLAAELPEEVAEATAASQLRDNNVCLVAEPLLFGEAATLLSTCLVTMQSDQDFASPIVVDTTGLKPAALRAALASLYFFPVTVGDELADATVVTENVAIATTHPAITIRATCMGFISVRLDLRVLQRRHRFGDARHSPGSRRGGSGAHRRGTD